MKKLPKNLDINSAYWKMQGERAFVTPDSVDNVQGAYGQSSGSQFLTKSNNDDTASLR